MKENTKKALEILDNINDIINDKRHQKGGHLLGDVEKVSSRDGSLAERILHGRGC